MFLYKCDIRGDIGVLREEESGVVVFKRDGIFLVLGKYWGVKFVV